jgi:ATP-dependent RNA helicase DeaD
MLFEELGLKESIIKAVTAMGFTTPTPIQEKVIPVLLQNERDMVGLAQTGTGKTAAFGLPLLHLLDEGKKLPQALIVCPTRELCMQIVTEMMNFKKYMSGVNIVAVYGGTSISMQIRDIRRGVQIIVATPGRLIDLVERKALDLNEIKYVVLDEADEMLNMGFKEDIEFVLKNTPMREHVWLFSATMPAEIKRVSAKYMTNPVEISVGTVNAGNKNIDHQYYITSAQHRYETLKRLIDFNPEIYGIIFVRTKIAAQEIAEKLNREGYDIDALHGDLTQQQRDKVMNRFRDRSLQLLIATDVAARGIDVPGISHVINYELPDDTEVYTHRSGRTGRAGKLGISLSIIHSREMYKLKQIQKMVKLNFNQLEIPSGTDVCRKQFYNVMDKLLVADISNTQYETYIPYLQEKFADVSKEEILQRVAALEFDRFLKYYENSEDLNMRAGSRDPGGRMNDRMGGGRNDRGGRFEGSNDRRGGGNFDRAPRDSGRDRDRNFAGGDANYKRLFINLGTKDGFYKSSFLQFVLDMSDMRKDVLGRIDMKEMNSWVEVETGAANKMIKAIDGKKFKGRNIRMNEAN